MLNPTGGSETEEKNESPPKLPAQAFPKDSLDSQMGRDPLKKKFIPGIRKKQVFG